MSDHVTDDVSIDSPALSEPSAQSGLTDERFAAVRDLFNATLRSGADHGASLCVLVDGVPVVDLWGGWADAARTRPWQRLSARVLRAWRTEAARAIVRSGWEVRSSIELAESSDRPGVRPRSWRDRPSRPGQRVTPGTWLQQEHAAFRQQAGPDVP